jgi:hypothetical protein
MECCHKSSFQEEFGKEQDSLRIEALLYWVQPSLLGSNSQIMNPAAETNWLNLIHNFES